MRLLPPTDVGGGSFLRLLRELMLLHLLKERYPVGGLYLCQSGGYLLLQGGRIGGVNDAVFLPPLQIQVDVTTVAPIGVEDICLGFTPILLLFSRAR